MFDTLLSKTLFVTGTQVALTCAATYFLIGRFKAMYLAKSPLVTATENESGELDLEVDQEAIKMPFWILFGADIVCFLALLFYGQWHPRAGYPLFCVWSVITGFEIALALLTVDENLGVKALRLTALLTFGAAMIGMYSGINFSWLGEILFSALSLLILFDFCRLLLTFSNTVQLIGSLFGAILFVFYLVFDFNRLDRIAKYGDSNTWARAMDLSINLYLDVVNLFLEIVDVLSRLHKH